MDRTLSGGAHQRKAICSLLVSLVFSYRYVELEVKLALSRSFSD